MSWGAAFAAPGGRAVIETVGAATTAFGEVLASGVQPQDFEVKLAVSNLKAAGFNRIFLS